MTASPTLAHAARTPTCPQFGHAKDDATTLRIRTGASLRRAWRGYWERRARRATILILCSLDERTLRDIGISPSEIQSCVYSPSGDRLRRYNDTWPWRSGR